MENRDLSNVIRDLKIFIKKLAFPELEDEKWIIGTNYIAHKKNKKQHDVVKMYFKEKSNYLDVHISRMIREHKAEVVQRCLELLRTYQISCVVDINGRIMTSDERENTVTLHHLIEAFKEAGRPDHMLKLKWFPFSDNNDPRLEIKRSGSVVIVFRTTEEIRRYIDQRNQMSVQITKLKQNITKKLEQCYPEAKLDDHKRVSYQGVNVFYNIKEIITSEGSSYRQRVDDIKWVSEDLADVDVFVGHIQDQIKKQRLKNLFH